jgi:hypothetical protein
MLAVLKRARARLLVRGPFLSASPRTAQVAKGERMLENLALRQQLTALKPGKHKPKLAGLLDRGAQDVGQMDQPAGNREARDSDPRPESMIDWLVWLLPWPVVTVAWFVTVSFVLRYVAVGLYRGGALRDPTAT